MRKIKVRWEEIQKREAVIEVSDDNTSDQITQQADTLAQVSAVGTRKMVLSVSWEDADGRTFGGRVR